MPSQPTENKISDDVLAPHSHAATVSHRTILQSQRSTNLIRCQSCKAKLTTANKRNIRIAADPDKMHTSGDAQNTLQALESASGEAGDRRDLHLFRRLGKYGDRRGNMGTGNMGTDGTFTWFRRPEFGPPSSVPGLLPDPGAGPRSSLFHRNEKNVGTGGTTRVTSPHHTREKTAEQHTPHSFAPNSAAPHVSPGAVATP